MFHCLSEEGASTLLSMRGERFITYDSPASKAGAFLILLNLGRELRRLGLITERQLARLVDAKVPSFSMSLAVSA
jgi:hypothetical protein